MPHSYAIPYTEFAGSPTPAFPKGRLAKRPILSLTLVSGSNRLSCQAIVDSGADHCVFPQSFMGPLGLDHSKSPVEGTSGVGSTNLPTHFANIVIDLQGLVRIPVYAGFTTGIDKLGIGLLGQAGFFEAFRVTFDYAGGFYHLEGR